MKIVVLDGHTLNPGDLSWANLETLGDVTIYERTPKDMILERSKDAEIILTNKTPLDADTLNRLTALRYIGVLATGFNVIDIEKALEKGIIVSNVPGYGTTSVAQMTFALLLELCQHVQSHNDVVKAGKWTQSPDWCFWDFPLVELSNKTLGIVGFGNIGGKVADVATAFGMNVIAANIIHTDQSHRPNFQWRSIPQLLAEADVVSLHCPLTPETNGLINKSSLQKMKPNAFLLNTSRGQLIVDQDLADALNDNTIAGAGLDVLSSEPPSLDNPLLKAKNCLITPHISWATKEARERLLQKVIDNLSAFIDGQPMNVVKV